jgi:hypothetical protein
VLGQFRSRIVGHGFEDPQQLLAHPQNWRIHSALQEAGLESVLADVGWVRGVLVNRRTQHVLDGHLRVALAIRKEERLVPVDYVDLTVEEELVILATLDPLAAMAGTDKDKLAGILQDLTERHQIDGLLETLRAQATITAAEASAAAETKSLAETFGVPPFSVLNAREGWWQDRKRAWLALGIQSELGRGDNLQSLSSQAEDYRQNKGSYAKSGAVMPTGARMSDAKVAAGKKKRERATPGGSKMPAANYSKNKARGDGRGRAVRG